MPTRRISEFKHQDLCRDPKHSPPTMIVLKPGVYEHTCPRCGNVIRFIVPPGPTL